MNKRLWLILASQTILPGGVGLLLTTDWNWRLTVGILLLLLALANTAILILSPNPTSDQIGRSMKDDGTRVHGFNYRATLTRMLLWPRKHKR